MGVESFNLQRPLFLLTRREAVAEGLPFHAKLLVGQGALNLMTMFVSFAVAHPDVAEGEAITVFLFVGEFTVDEVVPQINGSHLNDVCAGHKRIDDMHIA